MKMLKWLLSRLAVALGLGIGLGLLIYYVLVPVYVDTRTRQEASPEQFTRQSGSGAAGSRDAVYFVSRFECRNTITEISGPSPDAVYWMIGIYDNRFQRIPGGHINDTTAEIGADGYFHVVIQQKPGNAQNTLECGNVRSGLIIMRVFLPDDPDAVVRPTIERKSLP
jgi:uncharacterized membrane protein